MEKEKQIEEFANDIYQISPCTCLDYDETKQAAECLYKAGYRKQRQGKWEELIGERWFGSERCEKYTYYVCSECRKRQSRTSPYCPNCGAVMTRGKTNE